MPGKVKSIRLAEVLERATSRAGNGDMREPVGPESACATPDIDLAEITRAWRERGGRAEDAAAFPVRLPRALPPMRGPTRSAPIEPPPADPSPEAAKAEGRRQKAEGGGERAAETGPVSVVDDLFRELLEGTGEPAPYDPRPSTEEARVAFREIFEDVEEVSDEDLLPESLAAEMDGEAGSSPPPDDEAPTRDSVERLLDHALGEDRDERPSGPAAEAPPIREETEPDFMEPETEVDPVGEVLREFATGPVATSAPAAGVDSFLDDILGAPPAGEMPPVRPPPPAASPPAPTSSAAGPPAVTPPAGASRPSTADELGFLFDELATAASPQPSRDTEVHTPAEIEAERLKRTPAPPSGKGELPPPERRPSSLDEIFDEIVSTATASPLERMRDPGPGAYGQPRTGSACATPDKESAPAFSDRDEFAEMPPGVADRGEPGSAEPVQPPTDPDSSLDDVFDSLGSQPAAADAREARPIAAPVPTEPSAPSKRPAAPEPGPLSPGKTDDPLADIFQSLSGPPAGGGAPAPEPKPGAPERSEFKSAPSHPDILTEDLDKLVAGFLSSPAEPSRHAPDRPAPTQAAGGPDELDRAFARQARGEKATAIPAASASPAGTPPATPVGEDTFRTRTSVDAILDDLLGQPDVAQDPAPAPPRPISEIGYLPTQVASAQPPEPPRAPAPPATAPAGPAAATGYDERDQTFQDKVRRQTGTTRTASPAPQPDRKGKSFDDEVDRFHQKVQRTGQEKRSAVEETAIAREEGRALRESMGTKQRGGLIGKLFGGK